MTARVGGSASNYPISATSTTDEGGDFASPSFTPTPSGATLTGGTDSGSSLATPVVTLYSSDAADRLAQVIQGVQTRTFTYDGLGRLTSRNTPEAGTENFYFTMSDNVTLCAGAAGAICRKTDARGITTTYAYDSLSRVKSKTFSNGQTGVTYIYDQGGASAHALGRRTTTAHMSGIETYQYNAMGWISYLNKQIGSTSYLLTYQYNSGGRVTNFVFPSGHNLLPNFDNIGRLQSLTDGFSTTYASVPSTNGYNAAGQLLSLTYGNGVVASFAYSPARQQLTNMAYVKGTQTLFGLNYFYQSDQTNCLSGTSGNDGQIECITDLVDSGRTLAYTYDALGRLSTAVTNGSTGYPKWGLSETIDRYGNRLSQNQTAGAPPYNTLSFGTTPPANGAYTNHPDGYSFDPSGNMLNDGNNSLVYDAENCLTTSANSSSGTSTYTCDDGGIRVKKALQNGSTTVYIFSGGKDIAEYDNGASTSSPSREYIYWGGRLIATVQGTITTYHHSDHLSVRVSTDANGNKLGEQGHYPFGEAWYASNTTTKFIFTSYERDSESGNDYAMARFYINRFGRFCSADPLMGTPSDPQSWNRYAYVRNNPVNIIDPSGQGWLSWLFKAILAIVGFLFHIPGLATIPGGVGVGTPPIFDNGPFSDSAATLNSIYHPNDLSKFGIENFALIQPTLNLSRMGPCTVGLYGVLTKYFRPSEPDIDAQHPGFDGRFDGQRLRFKWPTGIIPGASFTVMNDVHMTLSEARAAAPPGYDLAHGYMDLSNPYLTHTLAGQDAYETVKVQVIELGNSLTKISGTMSDEQMVVSDRTPNPGNPYAATKVPGLKLWNCLLGINN